MIFDKKLKIILLCSFFFKLVVIFLFHEKSLSDEWVILFNNYKSANFFSYYEFDGQYLPTSYMPPLYFFFLYFCKLISFEVFNFLYIVYFFQIFLSTASVILFYKICENFFNKNISLLGSLIFAFFPLLVFSNSIISSATHHLFFYLLFFYLFLDVFTNNQSHIRLLLLGITSATCLVLRGEFLIIFLFSILYWILIDTKKIKAAAITFCITLILVSPYVLRNYINTGKPHIVNVAGFNLWKGNNHLAKVEGFHSPLHPNHRLMWPKIDRFNNLYQKLDKVEKNKEFETNRDKVFKKEALNNIFSDKKKYLNLYIKKVVSYFFIDLNSSRNNYYHPTHVLPILIFSVMCLPGIFIGLKKKKDLKLIYLFLVLILLTLLMSIFFILPRYKISIISIQILFSLFYIKYLFDKIKKSI